MLVLPRVVLAAEECLTEPTGEKSDAQRWYYRFDRGTNRRCWYLKDANGNTRDAAAPMRAAQQPTPWDFAQPAPPKLTPRRTDGPVARTSDALAEAPQPRLRADLAVRGTPKPQNLATPTTLTASDTSLPRSLDSSPWPSAPPQQADPIAADAPPPAMADDGNAEPDANAAPTADGPIIAPKPSKPEAPIHVLMLVVIGALAISGLLASALYRLSRMGRRQRRNGSWHADAVRMRRSRIKPRSKAPQGGMRASRGSMPAAPSHPGGGRGSQPASALDLASARLSASTDQIDPRAQRPAPSPQHQDHPAVAARRRDRDAAAEMQRSQSTDAVWQAVDELVDRAAVRRAEPSGAQIAATNAPPSPVAATAASPAAPAQAQLTAAQMAAAQAAAAKIAAAQASAAAAAASPRSPTYAAPTAPAEPWPAAQRVEPANPTRIQAAAAMPPAAPPPAQAAATAAPPAPVDVSEIVSALRKARSSDVTSPSAGAPIDAAKVIAALLVSRAAKRHATQPGEASDDPAAAALAETAPPTQADAAPRTAQASQHLTNHPRGGQPVAQPVPGTPDQPASPRAPSTAPADPAAALIETLRAHAARQPAPQPDDDIAVGGPAMMSEAPAAEDDELDDPAAALINLLQSRFSLPEDELEAEPQQEEFSVEAQQDVAHMHDDPAARLMSLLESRSSIPAALPIDRPQAQQQPQRPSQQRPLFVPTPFEDPATPPLDFIPRPPALRPRPRNIQQDDELDGIQDILARLGRRA
ncbi:MULTISPECIES: hypothetical protein [unclassified Bradyrhizobium]|uniref:hypothetical protein n=1 Tax=unclassified Bradyrhizobium TaxID=2631580 RepID=UPI0029160B5E|nr:MULTISPECIES: hypothetical protein [unclassified Bradyrhizobium]